MKWRHFKPQNDNHFNTHYESDFNFWNNYQNLWSDLNQLWSDISESFTFSSFNGATPKGTTHAEANNHDHTNFNNFTSKASANASKEDNLFNLAQSIHNVDDLILQVTRLDHNKSDKLFGLVEPKLSSMLFPMGFKTDKLPVFEIEHALDNALKLLEHLDTKHHQIIADTLYGKFQFVFKYPLEDNFHKIAPLLNTKQFELLLSLECRYSGFAFKHFDKFYEWHQVSILKRHKDSIISRLSTAISFWNLSSETKKIFNHLSQVSSEEGLRIIKEIFKEIPWPKVQNISSLARRFFTHDAIMQPLQRRMVLEAMQPYLSRFVSPEQLISFMPNLSISAQDDRQVRKMYFDSVLSDFHASYQVDLPLSLNIIKLNSGRSFSNSHSALIVDEYQCYFYDKKSNKKRYIFPHDDNNLLLAQLRQCPTGSRDSSVTELIKLRKALGIVSASPKDKEVLDVLVNALQKSSDKYLAGVLSNDNMQAFNQACHRAIQDARQHISKPELLELVAKIFLTIISIGLIPIALSFHQKITKDTWHVRLFKSSAEQKIDDVEETMNILYDKPTTH